MLAVKPLYIAQCQISHQVVDAKTGEPVWKPHRELDIEGDSVDIIMSKAYRVLTESDTLTDISAAEISGYICNETPNNHININLYFLREKESIIQ